MDNKKEKRGSSRVGVHRSTEDELAEKEDLVYHLLALGSLPSVIKAAFRKKYGDDTPARTITGYITRARARMLEDMGKDKDQLRSESLAFYAAISRNPNAADRDRVLARERIDRLYGLDAPTKTEISGKDGSAIKVENTSVTDDQRANAVLKLFSKVLNRTDKQSFNDDQSQQPSSKSK